MGAGLIRGGNLYRSVGRQGCPKGLQWWQEWRSTKIELPWYGGLQALIVGWTPACGGGISQLNLDGRLPLKSGCGEISHSIMIMVNQDDIGGDPQVVTSVHDYSAEIFRLI